MEVFIESEFVALPARRDNYPPKRGGRFGDASRILRPITLSGGNSSEGGSHVKSSR
jgi:hypothetical protein